MAKKKMPHDIKPMLAKLVAGPFDRKGWFFEVKWDGYRAIAEVTKGSVHLYSRNGLSFDGKYQPVEDALKKIKHDVVFDGEIIALHAGKPDFHTLQQHHEKPAPLQYAIFDLLYLDGKDVRGEPLRERKKLLKKIFPKRDKVLVYSDDTQEKGTHFFAQVQKLGLEGMVAKDAESSYQEDARTGSWQKVKTSMSQEAIIIGFTQPRGSRKDLGALVLAAHQGGKLVYIGHSGGGFTQQELQKLHQKLLTIKVAKSPVSEKVPVNSPITWVKPAYVCAMRFTEWTPEGHMRHPMYAGLRMDKKPKYVVREVPDEASAHAKAKQVSGTVGSRVGGRRRKFYQQENFRRPGDLALPEHVHPDLQLTHLDKIFWPKEKYTKGDLIEYYDTIADVMLPYLLDRPQNLNRHPNGSNGKSFYQKNITADVPSFVTLHSIYSENNDAKLHYLLCQNKETLLYLANLGCIEINPWNSRIGNLDNPDYLIIDLDPGDNTFDEVITVAREVHRVLTLACEEHYVKTSGKTGMHICVPLGAQYPYEDITPFAELIARLVNRALPELTSIERSPAKRKKKIYLDYLQNRKAQTIAAPYSVRPFPGATVSTPLEWSEVRKGLDPSKFTIKTISKRLKKKGDLWAPVLAHKIDLAKSIACLQKEIDR
jgi:bifunctional non-homologous end joining protein LigD